MKKVGAAAAIAVGSVLSACGSCFARGTRVGTPRGAQAIEDLVVGDRVIAWDPVARRASERAIAGIRRSRRADLAKIRAGERVIAGVTLDHPIFDARSGAFVEVGDLSLGARLIAWRGAGEVEEIALDAISLEAEVDAEVFDLTIEGPEHDFFADGILAHNKSFSHDAGPPRDAIDAPIEMRDACFAAGTLVTTPEGPRGIETLAVGDRVWSWDLARSVPVVRELSRIRCAERDDLVELRAGAITVRAVTLDHPLYDVARREFVAVGALTLRSRLVAWQGGEARAAAITSLSRIARRARVYDLSVDGPEHDFFADGVLAHNKSDAGRPVDAHLDAPPRVIEAGVDDAGAGDAGAGDAG